MNNPYLKRWQRNNQYPRDGETWEQFYDRIAQGMSEGENSRSEVEGEARQPGPKDAPNP